MNPTIVKEIVNNKREGYFLTLDIELRPETDIILPTLSSKLLKSIVASGACNYWIWKLYEKQGPIKPVTFRLLEAEGGRKLYKKGGSNPSEILTLKASSKVNAKIVVYIRGKLDDQIDTCSGSFNFGQGILNYYMRSFTIAKASEASANVEGVGSIKLTFRTPTAIASKLMTPPWAANISRRYHNLYRLLPTPSLLISNTITILLGLVGSGELLDNRVHYYLGRLADLDMVETDYRLRPETVIVGRDEYGRLREFRGFTGYVIYRIRRNSATSTLLDKVFPYVMHLGIGKLRAMGMGEVSLEPLDGKG